MAGAPARSTQAVVAILAATILAGLIGAPSADIGDGTAEVEVVSPTGDRLVTEPGRFGTAATYVRLPDLVADVSSVTDRPRLVYQVTVPALDIEIQRTRLLRDSGRVRIQVPDRAFPPGNASVGGLPESGTYPGRIVVRVQSFSEDRTVVNRTIHVEVGQ